MIIKYSQYLVVLYFIVSKQYHLGKMVHLITVSK